MAKVLLKNKKTNEQVLHSLGFNILVLIFGPFKILYDREYSLGFGMLIVSHFFGTLLRVRLKVMSEGMLTEIEGIIYTVFLNGIFHLVLACFYNKYHVKRLIEKGYEPVDEEGEILLKKYGIEYEVLADSVEKEALSKDESITTNNISSESGVSTVEEGILLKNEENNSQIKVTFGFSILALLFGFLVPLLQGHFSLFFKMLLFSIFSIILVFPVFWVIYSIVLGFVYNEYRVKELIKEGYRPVDERGKRLLKLHKIDYEN